MLHSKSCVELRRRLHQLRTRSDPPLTATREVPPSLPPDRSAGAAATLNERPPRLVLRFALVTAACLGVGAAAILGFVRHTDARQAERAAATRAQLAVEGVLADALEPGDLHGLTPKRRADLQRSVQPLLSDDLVLITASHRGRVFWATDGRGSGASTSRPSPGRQASGRLRRR